MSFRDIDSADASLDSQLRALKKTVSSAGLPSGFEWIVYEKADGTKSLTIVESGSNRVVFEGY
jgi:hypothetical protein